MCSVLLNVCDNCNPGLTVWLKRSTASEGMRDFLWPISFCRVLIPVFYQKAFDNTVVNSECVCVCMCVLYCMRMGQWCMEIRGLLFSCICPKSEFSLLDAPVRCGVSCLRCVSSAVVFVFGCVRACVSRVEYRRFSFRKLCLFRGSEPTAVVFPWLCSQAHSQLSSAAYNGTRKMTFQNILDQNASPQCLMLPFHLQAYIPDFNVFKVGVLPRTSPPYRPVISVSSSWLIIHSLRCLHLPVLFSVMARNNSARLLVQLLLMRKLFQSNLVWFLRILEPDK